MNRFLLVLLLFVTGSSTAAQPPPYPMGRVTGFHVEAVSELSVYTGTVNNGNVSFEWRSQWLHINSADDRQTPLECQFTDYDRWHKLVKQTCTITHYLIVDYQNDTRYCEVSLAAWDTSKVGQLVTISVTAAGRLVCAV